MDPAPPLPAYSEAELARLSATQLIDRLIGDEDRVPRNLIDECARRGEAMTECVGRALDEGRFWNDGPTMGEWWLALHAAMILGLIDSEPAGLLLARFMRRISEEKDEDLQDWLAGSWPALFRNKPGTAVEAAREVCMDRTLGWFARVDAGEVVVEAARRRGGEDLDQALAWVAGMVADRQEDRDLRFSAACTLLDFPRAQYRGLLEDLAAEQSAAERFFSVEDIRDAYAACREGSDRERFKDPWSFYSPACIDERQRRWAEEAAAEEQRERALPESDAISRSGATFKVGRNDPCPCGSGKKYKKCCLKKEEEPSPDELAWRRARRALDGLPKAMLRTASAQFGPRALEEAWAEFNLWASDAGFDAESPYLPVFLPWYLHDWRPDPQATAVPREARAETAAAAHLRIAGRRLDPLAKRYIEACAAAPFSFHEVLGCEPGRGLRLRDVLLGTEIDVLEREGSAFAETGDLVYAKAVPIDGVALLEGCTPVLIPPVWKPKIIELRERLAAQGAARDSGLLRRRQFELRELYLEIADRLLHPRMPQLANTDGDPLELRSLVFDIESPQEAFDALKGLAAGEADDDLLRDARRDAAGTLARVDFTWRREGSDTVLGTVHIDGLRLTAEANSTRRAEALRRAIEERLAGRCRYRAGTVQSVESLLRRQPTPAERSAAKQRDTEQARLAALPEVKAAITAHLREHYRRWVDERIPALGERTPREAVGDAAGREAVEALLMQFERDGSRMQPPLDPSILRELRETLRLTPRG